MKVKKCPYCGRRISYFTIFNEKKQGKHICRRCGKESKLIVSKKIYLGFLAAIAISAVIVTVWIGLGYMNNPIGVILTAIPLIIFYFCTPRFEKVYPLKKYKKSMEAAKAAREYGGEMKFKQNIGNNMYKEEPNISTPVLETENDFSINADIFSTIKTNRKKPVVSGTRPIKVTEDSVKLFEKEEKKEFVPIIENNRASHISSSENVPLQKIHKEKPVFSENVTQEFEELNINKNRRAENIDKRKKAEGSKYSANRRF